MHNDLGAPSLGKHILLVVGLGVTAWIVYLYLEARRLGFDPGPTRLSLYLAIFGVLQEVAFNYEFRQPWSTLWRLLTAGWFVFYVVSLVLYERPT